MADSDKNIVITPNIGSSSDDPKIVFSGADGSTSAQNVTLYAYPSSSGTVSFEATAGQLLSITNNLTSGTIFSVNDVSGIPSIDVNADGTISLAEFFGNVGIGTSSPSTKLHVDGNTTITGTLNTHTIPAGTGTLALLSDLTSSPWTTAGSDIYYSTGDVGIGTSLLSSTYGKLTVSGDGITIADDGNAKLQIGRYSVGFPNSYIKMGANSNSLKFTNSTDTVDVMTILSGGNVGIGPAATTPSEKLHVDGNILTTGTLNTHTIPGGTGTLALTSDLYTNADVDAHLNQSNPTAGYLLSWNGSDYAWVADTGITTFNLAGNTGTGTVDVGNGDSLVVLGTTGQINSSIAANYVSLSLDPNINSIQSIAFEGSTDDANEITLTSDDPAADRTVTLADLSGYVALFDVAPTTTITATPAELNYMDGVTSNVQTQINALATSSSPTFTNTSTFTGDALFDTGVQEAFSTKTGATGTVAHDCNDGHVFYHTSLAADFTANFTNLGLTSGYATTITLVLVQGATPYIPTAVQVGGVAQTILWQSGAQPTGTPSGTDAVAFNILNNGGSYVVLGQLVDFA